jgi:transcriptional regulator
MYIPKHFEETDLPTLHALIRSHPLGAWVTHIDAALVVNHIPFLVDSSRGPHGTLVGHVARANPIWKSLSTGIDSVVIFQGPQSYITPSWYPSKHETGKAVPTWNYAVVHAHGTPRRIEDRDWLLDHVSTLTAAHESERAVPWTIADAPAAYIDALLQAIVGIEIPIARLDGKWKASQNRPAADRLGVIAGLEEQNDAHTAPVADLVRRTIDS